MRVKRLAGLGLVLAVFALLGVHGTVGVRGAGPLVVHEWGTITTRHAADGTPEGHLNQIDVREVLPAFVHRFEPPQTQASSKALPLAKSPLTPGRPDVTMRLETPVLYFYPPAGSGSPSPFDVNVTLRGGVLNEFYPRGEASVAVDVERVNAKMQAGVIKAWDGEVLNQYVAGSLRWNRVSLKETVPLPQTSNPIWLAPRNVGSSGVLVSPDEGERYLFYRGVAHLDALVQTALSPNALRLRAPRLLLWMSSPTMTIPNLWLVDIRADGSAAFREPRRLVIAKDAASAELASIPLFDGGDYTARRLNDLRASMKEALVAAGLFDDEADAMLRTWNESYFQRPGLRVFYIVPNQWIEYHLPLRLSVPAKLTRVLVGRIDLVRP